MKKYAFPVELVGILLITGGIALISIAAALIFLGLACVAMAEVHG